MNTIQSDFNTKLNILRICYGAVWNIFASGADSKTTVLCALQSDQLYAYSNLLHSLKIVVVQYTSVQ